MKYKGLQHKLKPIKQMILLVYTSRYNLSDLEEININQYVIKKKMYKIKKTSI